MKTEFSIEEQVTCVEREIRKRKSYYYRAVRDAKMTQAQAEREIACMTAVLATLQGLVPKLL